MAETQPADEHTAAGPGGEKRRGPLGDGTRLVVTTVTYGAVLFVLAGSANWPSGWLYLAMMCAVMCMYAVTIGKHPDLVAERRKPPADAKTWDKPLVALIGVVGPVLLIVTCGLDRRFGWSPALSGWWVAAGLLLIASGSALTNWAVASNRFFSAVVRIQRDRGQRVVDAGPYRLIRHPGYLGSLIYMPGAALALGSLWALALVAAIGAIIVLRTGLEDRVLRTELDGYETYAHRVRYRLVPGIW